LDVLRPLVCASSCLLAPSTLLRLPISTLLPYPPLFRIYVGYLLVTGGRYDDLVARFGRPLPATGFAVGLERLLLALERQGVWGLPPASGPLFITFDPARREEADRKSVV